MCDLQTIYLPCEGVEVYIREIEKAICSTHLSFYSGIARLMRALSMQTCEQVVEALEKIPPQQKTVIAIRFGLDGHGPKTLLTTGTKLHLSQERVRMIEKEGFGNIGELSPKHLQNE